MLSYLLEVTAEVRGLIQNMQVMERYCSFSSFLYLTSLVEDADPCVDIRFSESSQLLDRNLKFAVL